MLETSDYTIRIGSTPTFLYFDIYIYIYIYIILIYMYNIIYKQKQMYICTIKMCNVLIL